jgi:ribosomal protein S24E
MCKSMGEIDITAIDAKIRKKFTDERTRLPEFREKIEELDGMLSTPDQSYRVDRSLRKARDELAAYMEDIEVGNSLNFYLEESAQLIHKFKAMLSTRIKTSFMGRKKQNDGPKRKIIREYLEIARRHTQVDVLQEKEESEILCVNCPNLKNFEILDDNTYVCQECFSQQEIIKHTPSWNDIDRVNISQKYMYDRKVHFRDCIHQYQGKQNSTIPQKIYDDLENEFENHYLLVGNKDTVKGDRFVKITKDLIRLFLGELGYNKHYENVHLIHYNFTGIKPDDISHLEDQLLDDFDSLTETYDSMFKHLSRKSFISTQYVLFQLLRRHKHPCNVSDFNILKTQDRKAFHDEITRACFISMGWNHVSLS